MTIPTAAQTTVNGKQLAIGHWIEIAGIPYAYGTFLKSSSWFGARAVINQFLGVKQSIIEPPKGYSQKIDTLAGGSLSSGNVVFDIVDLDGAPTAWTNLNVQDMRLTADLTIAGTVINVSTLGTVNVNDYLYLGLETVKVTAIGALQFTVVRGMFRSTAIALGIGFPVSTVVNAMANRAAWWNVTVKEGFQTASVIPDAYEPDKIIRFAGVLKDFTIKKSDLTSFSITAESSDRLLDNNCFIAPRVFTLASDLSAVGGTQQLGNGQWLEWVRYTGGQPGDWNTLLEKVLMRVDDEIVGLEKINSLYGYMFLVIGRGLMGTTRTKHDVNAPASEVFPVVEYNVSGSLVEQVSKFSSAPTAGSPAHADHPIVIILQVLLSTGLGTNFVGGSRNYDVLPLGCGMAYPVSKVNFTEILAAIQETPALRFGGVVEGTENFTDFMREMLAFTGYYFYISLGDLLTIRKLRPPLPGTASKAVTASNRIRNSVPSWSSNWGGALNEIDFKFGYDIVTQCYKRVSIQRLLQADIFARKAAGSLEFSCRFLYPQGTNIPGQVAARAFDVDKWLLERVDFFQTRYSKPPPIVTERCDFSMLGVEVGDLVTITHPWLPNVSSGTRGLNAEIGEVIEKNINDKLGIVDLTLLLTGYSLADYRYVAPSLLLTGGGTGVGNPGENWIIDGGGHLYIYNTNVTTNYAIQGDTDNSHYDPSTASFQQMLNAGMRFRVWGTDFNTATLCDLNATTGTDTITLARTGGGSMAGLVAAGYMVTLAEYDNVYVSGADVRLAYGFLADNGTPPKLGAGQARAHKLFPG